MSATQGEGGSMPGSTDPAAQVQRLRASSFALWRYTLPFARPVAGLVCRRGFLLSCQMDDLVGWGEIAPWPGRAPLEESQLRALLPSVRAALASPAISLAPAALLPPELAADLDAWPPPLAQGVLAALWQLAAAARGLPLCRWLRGDAPLAVQGAALLLEDEEAGMLPPAARTIKVKVRTPLDLWRIEAVRARFPEAHLRADGNRALDEGGARALMEGAAACGVGFFEEPSQPACVPALWAAGFPVALDESLEDGALAESLWSRARALVLKPALLGPRRMLRAIAAHRELVFSSPFESAVGRSLLAHLQAAFAPALDPGIGTGRFLACDLAPLEDPMGHISLAAPLVPDTARLTLLHEEFLS